MDVSRFVSLLNYDEEVAVEALTMFFSFRHSNTYWAKAMYFSKEIKVGRLFMRFFSKGERTYVKGYLAPLFVMQMVHSKAFTIFAIVFSYVYAPL